MSRSLRVEYPGAVYHAMAQGNNGQDVFLNEDGFRLYLHTLGEACLQTGWRIHAYCLMSNHYHLLLDRLRSRQERVLRYDNTENDHIGQADPFYFYDRLNHA